MKLAVLFLFLAGLLFATTSDAAVGVCPPEGCKATYSPVCGENGITFLNSCLAVCQGVGVISRGPCTNAAGSKVAATVARAGTGSVVTDAVDLGELAKVAATVTRSFDRRAADRFITVAEMQRYSDEDMVLVGVLKSVDNFNPNEDVKASRRNTRVRITELEYDKAAAAVAAATPDGLVYKPASLARAVAASRAAVARGDSADLSAPFNPDAADGAADGDMVTGKTQAAASTSTKQGLFPVQDAIVPSEEALGNRRRSLKTIFGVDDRLEIKSSQSYPWNVHGLVSFTKDGVSGWGCSAALVGGQTALTAAHCVLSKTRGGVASSWRIAIDHNRYGPDSRYGWANARRYFYYTNYWDNWVPWDIAIVVLDKPLGNTAGYLGVDYSAGSPGYKGSLVTAGYPGDKPYGSFWYINGGSQCYVSDPKGTDYELLHKCDIKGGQSGSPMWVPGTRRVRGVVSWDLPDTNGALGINKFFYDFVVAYRTKTS